MKSNTVTAAVLTAVTVIVLSAVAWVGFARSPQQPTPLTAKAELSEDDTTPSVVPSPIMQQPREPAPPQMQSAVTDSPLRQPGPITPVTPAPSPLPSISIRGLHVLCPAEDGTFAHLLLTADTYYRAATPEEEIRLTTLLGPPVTTVDPALLPPQSPISVTEALELVTLDSSHADVSD